MRSRLELIPAFGCRESGAKKRVLGPKPTMVGRMPAFIDVQRTGIYTRGACSPLTRMLGNPHAWLRPLRQALYSRFGLGAVREVFPSWDARAGKVVWSNDEVLPDDAMDHLLEDPVLALQRLVPDLEEQVPADVDAVLRWRHIFGVHAVVHELCCAAKDSSLFRALVEDTILAASAPTKRSGKGKGKPGKNARSSEGQISILGNRKGLRRANRTT